MEGFKQTERENDEPSNIIEKGVKVGERNVAERFKYLMEKPFSDMGVDRVSEEPVFHNVSGSFA